jgi:hypothetical protein
MVISTGHICKTEHAEHAARPMPWFDICILPLIMEPLYCMFPAE